MMEMCCYDYYNIKRHFASALNLRKPVKDLRSSKQ